MFQMLFHEIKFEQQVVKQETQLQTAWRREKTAHLIIYSLQCCCRSQWQCEIHFQSRVPLVRDCRRAEGEIVHPEEASSSQAKLSVDAKLGDMQKVNIGWLFADVWIGISFADFFLDSQELFVFLYITYHALTKSYEIKMNNVSFLTILKSFSTS